jgi:hypothetical protein
MRVSAGLGADVAVFHLAAVDCVLDISLTLFRPTNLCDACTWILVYLAGRQRSVHTRLGGEFACGIVVDRYPCRMSPLIDAVETELETDFAILLGDQPGGAGLSDAGSFAVTARGSLQANCGTKYARVHIRAERWDDRPPLAEGWEDVDELPFAEAPGGGKLILSGFDPGDEGLDLSGLGSSRVQVFARGRHRYQYGSEPDTNAMPAEEWLLRFFPWPGLPQPLEGGPRRIAGEGGLYSKPGDAWLAAVRALDVTGWGSTLLGSPGYYLAHLALLMIRTAAPRQEIASWMARFMPPYQPGGADSERLLVPPRPGGKQDPLASATNRSPLATIGDTIDALLELGLILIDSQGGRELIVPNPAPEPAWERLGLSGDARSNTRIQALRSQHRLTASDLASALVWVGDRGLSASPRTLAMRWTTTTEDVVGAIRLLAALGTLVSDHEVGFDSVVDPDLELRLHPRT